MLSSIRERKRGLAIALLLALAAWAVAVASPTGLIAERLLGEQLHPGPPPIMALPLVVACVGLLRRHDWAPALACVFGALTAVWCLEAAFIESAHSRFLSGSYIRLATPLRWPLLVVSVAVSPLVLLIAEARRSMQQKPLLVLRAASASLAASAVGLAFVAGLWGNEQMFLALTFAILPAMVFAASWWLTHRRKGVARFALFVVAVTMAMHLYYLFATARIFVDAPPPVLVMWVRFFVVACEAIVPLLGFVLAFRAARPSL